LLIWLSKVQRHQDRITPAATGVENRGEAMIDSVWAKELVLYLVAQFEADLHGAPAGKMGADVAAIDAISSRPQVRIYP
jgi:hypothetical protein